ncbi:MAG: hypothetical protein V1874_13675 [Spirochaetota bacterium]
MKSKIDNKTKSALADYDSEEIAEIPEAIAESIIINGDEKLRDNLKADSRYKDYEELGINLNTLKSMTIIDEFETNSRKTDSISGDEENRINIQKLTLHIDSLTYIKKRKSPVKSVKTTITPKKEETKSVEKTVDLKDKDLNIIKHENVISSLKGEQENKKEKFLQEIDQDYITEINEEEFKIDNAAKIKSELKTVQTIEQKQIETIQVVNEKIAGIEEKIEKLLQKEEDKERKDINEISQLDSIKSEHEKIIRKIDIILQKESTSLDFKVPSISDKENLITIEVPDKLLGEPADFDMDEFGKIDLNEAEAMAEEDLLSLAKGDILEELKELDMLPSENIIKKNAEITRTKKLKIKKLVKAEKAQIKKIEEPVSTQKKEEVKANGIEEIEPEPKKEKIEYSEIKLEELTSTSENTVDIAEATEKNKKEGQAPVVTEKLEEVATKKEEETPAVTEKVEHKIKTNIISTSRDTNADINEKQKPAQEDFNPKLKDQNVFIIDNENPDKQSERGHFLEFNELDDMTSMIVDVVEGKAKQLAESDTGGQKAITGLIRDNYPSFKDLLREKELENRQLFSDEDIAFVENTFLSKDAIRKPVTPDRQPHDIAKENVTIPYEQTLGLIPDEIELIENQLFKIKEREIDFKKAEFAKTGFDQHPSDTITLSKYKYILPIPDSLMDNEKKSIEDDISSKNAVIFEEDVDKIKKKFEASMTTKIKETIQDITDKITIYEDNNGPEKSNKSNTENKEEIKKLLRYLDELLEKLPEDSIKHFADSEYYEIYKKVLKEMES